MKNKKKTPEELVQERIGKNGISYFASIYNPDKGYAVKITLGKKTDKFRKTNAIELVEDILKAYSNNDFEHKKIIEENKNILKRNSEKNRELNKITLVDVFNSYH